MRSVRLLTPARRRSPYRVDQPADAAEVLFVNHVHIAVADERVFADHALNLAFEQGQERILDPAVDEQIIRRDAGLAAVEQLAERKAARGDAQICGFIDDAGALPPNSSVTGVRVVRWRA